jgi:hypothetical protein
VHFKTLQLEIVWSGVWYLVWCSSKSSQLFQILDVDCVPPPSLTWIHRKIPVMLHMHVSIIYHVHVLYACARAVIHSIPLGATKLY